MTVVHSCAEARTSTRVYDCAVIDLDLPDGNGSDLAEVLLARGVARKVVFFTASSSATARDRALQLGVLIEKGGDGERLQQVVAACEADSERKQSTAD